MHTIQAGLIKYLVLWCLGLIRFRPAAARGGKKSLSKLDSRFKSMTMRVTDKRIPIKRFTGAKFILGDITSLDKLNGCGGFMTSAEWTPMLLSLLAVIHDESAHNSSEVLAVEYHSIFIEAASMAINLCIRLKSGRFKVENIPELDSMIKR